MTTPSSILACEIPWTEELGRLQCVGLQKRGVAKELDTAQQLNSNIKDCGMIMCCAVLFCAQSASVVSNPLQPHGLQPARFLCPGHSPGKNTGVGCRALLQKIFPTLESNPYLQHFLHCRQVLNLGSPWNDYKFVQIILAN